MSCRVTVVREQLEDREIANYVPLRDRFDLRVVRGGGSGPYSSTGLGLPVRRTRSLVELTPRPARRVVRRLIGDHLDAERHIAFERAVEGSRVLVVNETHMATSAQAAELRMSSPDVRVVTVCYENIPFRYEEDQVLARRKDSVRAATDLFIAMTPAARDALIEEGVDAARVEVQPYGVETADFAASRRSTQVRRAWGADDEDVVIIFTGRLIREKGLVDLIRAIGLARMSNAVLVLVGQGPERPRIERAALATGFGRLVIQSWVARTEIATLLASADVFAMPSLPTPYWDEQLGFSAIEAMASGLPIVAVASASLPFVVGDAGLYSDPYDIDGLVDSVRRVCGDPALRGALGAIGKERARAELDVDVVSSRLGDLIERVAS